MATKKKAARKAAKKAPAKKAPAKKAPAKKAARKAPAKKAARKAPAKKAARTPRHPPQSLILRGDCFEPEKVIVRVGKWLHVTSARDDRNVPVHVPECFGVRGPLLLKKRGARLKLRVIKDARPDTYPIQAPKGSGPNTDLKGEIEVVSGN
jgi:hypothetical protein